MIFILPPGPVLNQKKIKYHGEGLECQAFSLFVGKGRTRELKDNGVDGREQGCGLTARTTSERGRESQAVHSCKNILLYLM